MKEKQETRLTEQSPGDELEMLIREATASVEADLALEDAGWVNLSAATGEVITASERITNVKLSRLYALKDPMGKQAIRLWTDYTFGSGITWQAEDEKVTKALEGFWGSKANQSIFSARGQRKSSDKLLIDGEVFFAIFLGANGAATIRHIDPLEITEIIANPEDKEDIRYYRREWSDAQAKPHTVIYRSFSNIKDEATLDQSGKSVTKTDDALIYHLTFNTITKRGNPLLLPALIWMKYNTRFLASRIAIMLALAKFAWRSKVKGGQATVDAIKAKTHEQDIAAGSHLVENLGSDTQPIKTETGAQGAYQDGRMIKLMFCAGVGWPEQYFGDLNTGNLATAKTVELPVAKMCQSYQAIWNDTYKDIDEIVLAHNKIPPEKWYVDRDFPAIAPHDYVTMAQSIQQIVQSIPELGFAPDVMQQALLSIGVNNPGEVLDALAKEAKGNPNTTLIKALKQLRESLNKKE